jgi:hypothetical protein
MKQFDNLRQTSSVADYHAKFEQLAHRILLYNPSYDDTFLVVRFLNGLKDEIRAPIALHCPKDVDTASALALLQQEELDCRRRASVYKNELKDLNKTSSRVFTAGDKVKANLKKEDIRKLDKATGDEKLQALFAHRKAHGLCFTCGEKWTGRAHKCPDQVPLHVIQEVVELFQGDCESGSEEGGTNNEQLAECVMAVQPTPDPSHVPKRRKTIRFRGFIGKQELSILLDSGSSGTFISESVAQGCKSQLKPCA